MSGLLSESAFRDELSRLVEVFQKKVNLHEVEKYDESALRNDFLTPFWRALGWDTENREGNSQSLRDVEIETRVDIAGKKKRADYIFRTNGISRFVCEAKKPSEDLSRKFAYQAQRYAFNLGLFPALLSSFKEMQLFFVGGKPDQNEPFPAYKAWHLTEYKARASELWDLFSRESIIAGSLDKIVASLRKKPIPGKLRQGWLWIPERVRKVDATFLAYIEDQRVALARDLIEQNRGYEWDDATLNECIQRILDRILFVRICEDRDIDTGKTLEQIHNDWRAMEVNRPPLYSLLVGHFNSLAVTFNGALFDAGHESEKIKVSDTFLSTIIHELASDDSDYLFATLPVEILGSVYERFIGKTIRVTKGGKLKPPEPKDALRKTEGVYYTPRYIVDYIVEQTIGKVLDGKDPKKIGKLRFLDPACGSGSFLIRVFERVCEHYLHWFKQNPNAQRKDFCYSDAQGNLLLTTHLKRQIMRENVFGVDIDAQAIEVTMLSLYLKILEGETRSTLGLNYSLFPKETFLPDLSNNIRLGNSLVANDYFDLFAEKAEIEELRPFDWDVGFDEMIKSGGFDAVVGNPPYVTGQFMPDEQIEYLKKHYESAFGKFDLYMVFLEKAVKLAKKDGMVGFIIPNKYMVTKSGKGLRAFLAGKPISEIVDFGDSGVFEDVTNYPCIMIIGPSAAPTFTYRACHSKPEYELHRVEVPSRKLGAGPWAFSQQDEASVLDKLSLASKQKLGDVIQRFSTGVQTGADKILIPDQETVLTEKLEEEFLRKCLRGRNVKNYAIHWDGRYIIWPYDSETDEILSEDDLRKVRHIYKKLAAERPRLARRVWFDKSARELSGQWFGLMYREPDKNFEKLHIVSPCLADRTQFALNDQGFHFVTGTAGVIGLIPTDNSRANCLYLLGVLNSAVTEFFIKKNSPKFAGGFYKFTAPYLKPLPLPPLDMNSKTGQAALAKMVKLVDTMTLMSGKASKAKSDTQRKILSATLRTTSRRIDELVFEMYGLSEEEVKVLMRGLKGAEGRRADNPIKRSGVTATLFQ